MHGLSSWVRAAALGAGLMACGGRTGLDKPGDACLGISADCDGDAANGCEADLDTNRERCGACGDACEAGLFCSGGECVEGRRIVQVETRTGAQYARTADGRIFAWGTNDFGQVDPASSEPSIYTPRLVQLPVPSAEVTTSWVKTCSRGVDGSVWCWGTGVGEPPFEVDDLAGVTKLMGDQGGFCAFDAYRGQKCWSSASNDIGIGTGEGADSVRMDVPYE